MPGLGRAWDALVTGLGLLAGALFGLMALAIGVDVALRNLGAGGAGWLIEARVADGASRAGARFVLQPSCGALTDAALRAGELPEARHELVDLDGDGLDEVVTHRDVAEAHGRSTNLEVLRVGGGRLVRAGRVRVAYVGVDPELAGPGEVTCTGAARFAPHPDGGWLVEITSTRTAPSSLCLADGVHRLELGAAGLRRR